MSGPHQDQPLLRAGQSVRDAETAAILVHGRGAGARSILQLAEQFELDDVAYLAPQAARSTWYPNSFLAPVESNEPGRRSGMVAIEEALGVAEEADIPPERVLVAGFSQGACLASEFVARNPRRYGGLAVLSGGLIGESIDGGDYEGDLAGTPAFLGCSDVDPHIPEERVHETAAVLDGLGADVRTQIYEGMAHTVNDDELEAVASLLDSLSSH